MFKRAYAIALKPGLSEGERDELIRILREAPQYLPGMVYSIVEPALGPGPYDLVWDNAFADEEYYNGYLSHPYHCNVIDHYMYRESPSAAISSAVCLRWKDEAAPPGAVAAVAEIAPQAIVDPHEGPLFLVENVEILAGHVDEYLEALASQYLPMVRGKGIEQLMCLRSPSGTGENEIVLVWKLADWDAFVAYRHFFQFENEPASTEWIARIGSLRTGGKRRLMLAADYDAASSSASSPS